MLKVNDKIQVNYLGETYKTNNKWKYGRVAAITKHLIVIQFKHYREAFKKTDILSDDWVAMKLWQGNNWINVNRKVLN